MIELVIRTSCEGTLKHTANVFVQQSISPLPSPPFSPNPIIMNSSIQYFYQLSKYEEDKC